MKVLEAETDGNVNEKLLYCPTIDAKQADSNDRLRPCEKTTAGGPDEAH